MHENIVTKGEIARYEQFLLLSQCFQSYLMHNQKSRLVIEMG